MDGDLEPKFGKPQGNATFEGLPAKTCKWYKLLIFYGIFFVAFQRVCLEKCLASCSVCGMKYMKLAGSSRLRPSESWQHVIWFDRRIAGFNAFEMIDVQISLSQTLMVKLTGGKWRCSDIWSPFSRGNIQFATMSPKTLQVLLSKLQVLGCFPCFHQQGDLGSGSSPCSVEDLKVNIHFSFLGAYHGLPKASSTSSQMVQMLLLQVVYSLTYCR